jgi:hypothetical protein
MLTFEAKMWSDKCKAVDEVDKIFGCNYWLHVNLNTLQVPCSRSLQKTQTWLVKNNCNKMKTRLKNMNYRIEKETEKQMYFRLPHIMCTRNTETSMQCP